MPSIVDPALAMGGAWTVTRELVRLLGEAPVHPIVEVLACPYRTGAERRLRQFSSVLRSRFSGLPAKVEFSFSRAMAADLRAALLERPPDRVVLNGADMLWALPYLRPGTPLMVVAHNIEAQLLESQLGSFWQGVPVVGRLARREIERMRHSELEAFRSAGNVLLLSTADERYVRAHCPDVRTMLLPPVFREKPAGSARRRHDSEAGLQIGMLANFHWWPNRQGVEWFLREILPHAPEGLTLHLFGTGSESIAPGRFNVAGHGFVPDIRTVWENCHFMICPILSGGGVCVKVAEAMYHGMPVLATSAAVRGLPIEPNPGLVTLDSAADWIGFLHEGAPALAAATVPDSVSRSFRAEVYRGALEGFLGLEKQSRERAVGV